MAPNNGVSKRVRDMTKEEYNAYMRAWRAKDRAKRPDKCRENSCPNDPAPGHVRCERHFKLAAIYATKSYRKRRGW